MLFGDPISLFVALRAGCGRIECFWARARATSRMSDLAKVADAVPATATAATAPPPPPLAVHEKTEDTTSQPPPLPAHTVRGVIVVFFCKGRVTPLDTPDHAASSGVPLLAAAA